MIAMSHGQLYVASVIGRMIHLQIWCEIRLILSLSDCVACVHGLQSLAVVLLHSRFVKLFRDYFNHHGSISVAMALDTSKYQRGRGGC